MKFTFDQIPNASGYEWRVDYRMSNGVWTFVTGTIPANSSNRTGFEQYSKFYSSSAQATTVKVVPFVLDVDGSTRVYGELREARFMVNGCNWKSGKIEYWENASTYNSPILQWILSTG